MNSIRNGLGMRETEITGNHADRGIRISTQFPLKSITRSKGGLEGDNASGQAKAGERGENLSSFLELVANCGDNR